MNFLKIRTNKISNFLVFRIFVGLMFICAGCAKDDETKVDSPSQPAVIPCFSSNVSPVAIENGDFMAFKTSTSLIIDGCGDEDVWLNSEWYDLNYKWMGNTVDSIDYFGKFKVSWDEEYMYLLVEVIDNVLNPTLADGIDNYWKGDYVEVFIDENQSGGNHQYNHQAFAYHVSTEGHAIDKNTLQETEFFDEHVQVERINEENRYSWEMAISLYDDTFNEGSLANIPVAIVSNKVIGFSLAYGDNDGNGSRENFMGSRLSHGVNNDEGYVNSDVFGSLTFLE
ncbi:MAG: sugar-binding protein [Flavobacteriales bacterium]